MTTLASRMRVRLADPTPMRIAARNLRAPVTERWLTGVGALLVALGTWMRFGPADGELRVMGWDHRLGDLAEGWAFATLALGGATLFFGAMSLAREWVRTGRATSTTVVVMILAGGIGLAVALATLVAVLS